MKLRQVAPPVALMILTAGVAAYTYLVDRGTVSDADREARQRDVFPTFRVDEVTRVELTRPGDALVLERDADSGAGVASWTMTSPRRLSADPGAVDALLRELETATRVREVDDTIAAGLASPRVRGAVTMGPLVLRFALGADAPRPEGAAYLHVEDQGTFVVGRSLQAQLLRGSDGYRPRTLVPYGEREVARLRLTAPDRSGWTLEQHGAGFRLVPGGMRASRASVDRLFTALAEGTAESFLDDDAAADRALGPEALVISLSARDGKNPDVELRLGGACPDPATDVVLERTAPTRVAACVARSLAEAFTVNAADLVDKAPFFAHADEIEELRLEDLAGGPRVDLARKGAGWRERAPEDRDLSADEGESASILASALADARATEVLEPATLPRGSGTFVARSRATVIRTGGSVTEVVELSAPGADGTTRVRRLEDGAILLLPNTVALRLQPHAVALRGRAPWRTPIDPGAIVGIDSSCGTGEKLELQAGAWNMKMPAGFAPDPLAVSELTGALARSKVEAWVDESDDGSFGLSDPEACRVTMKLAGPGDSGVRHASVTFGGPSGDGFYARTSDDPAVFVAPGVLRALASRPPLDRRRFLLDRDSLTGLVVMRDGVRHRANLDTEGGSELADAVSGLVVKAALHTGRAAPGEGFDAPTLQIDATSAAEAGPAVETRLTFGARTQLDGVDGYFARAAGLDATFVVLRSGVDAVLSALRDTD